MSDIQRCPHAPGSVTTLLAVLLLGVRFFFIPASHLAAHTAPLVPALQHLPAMGANASAASVARSEPRTVHSAAAMTRRKSTPVWHAGPPPPPPLHPLIFMQRNIDEPNCTALGGLFVIERPSRNGKKQLLGKCKRRCTAEPPPSYTPRAPIPPLRFKARARAADGGSGTSSAAAASFAGHPTEEQRAAALRGCAGSGELACGFLAPSAFDAAVAAAPPHAHCRVVVLGAILILA